MSFAGNFAAMAAAFPEVWIDAVAHWDGEPVKDIGGAITTPGTPVDMPCRVQFDAVTQAMRTDAEFKESDLRILVLRNGSTQEIDTEAKIVVATGLRAGTWALMTAVIDPAGIGYECRGRRVR